MARRRRERNQENMMQKKVFKGRNSEVQIIMTCEIKITMPSEFGKMRSFMSTFKIAVGLQ